MNFDKLKKSRTEQLKNLQDTISNQNKGSSDNNNDNPNEWTVQRDKAENGYAVIRFLPGDDEKYGHPFVKVFDHVFKHEKTNKWMFEKCLTTKEEDCPICKINSELWNLPNDAGKDQAKNQKRKLAYYANVLVLEDPANPENEGKVKIYRFGAKIMDMISEALAPKFPDQEPLNPFDIWEGANFKIKIRKVEGYVNYDRSEFAPASSLYEGDEDKLKAVISEMHDLGDYVADDKFKSYEELEAAWKRVSGGDTRNTVAQIEEESKPAKKLPEVKAEVIKSVDAEDISDISDDDFDFLDDEVPF